TGHAAFAGAVVSQMCGSGLHSEMNAVWHASCLGKRTRRPDRGQAHSRGGTMSAATAITARAAELSAWAVLTRWWGVDRGHLRRAGSVHRQFRPEPVRTSQVAGRVSQRPIEPELGTVVVAGSGVIVDVGLLQLLKRRDD